MTASTERRAKKHQEIENHIITSACDILETQDGRDFTIRELCEKMGISTGLFYRHFKSKYDLFSYCVLRKLEREFAELERHISGLSLTEQLIQIALCVMKCTMLPGSESLNVATNSKDPQCNCLASREMTNEIIEKYIAHAYEQGFTLSEGRMPIQVCDDMILLIKGVVHEWAMFGDSYDPLARTEQIFRLTMKSLL